MQRVTFLCLMTIGLLFVQSVPADDKKPATKSLAEEAQLLAEKEGKTRWISDEFTAVSPEKTGRKAYLTIRFEPEKGKPSGKATLGTAIVPLAGEPGVEGGATHRFELVEKDGKRVIKLFRLGIVTIVDGKAKDVVPEPRILYYSLDGDKLVISPRLPDGWTDEAVKIHFGRDK